MAKNMRMPNGEEFSVAVPEYVKSGSPVAVGAFRGIAQTGRGEGGNLPDEATVWLRGSAEVTVTGALATPGLPVYINPANGELSTTATDNLLFGHNIGLKPAAAAGPVEVILLNGAAQA